MKSHCSHYPNFILTFLLLTLKTVVKFLLNFFLNRLLKIPLFFNCLICNRVFIISPFLQFIHWISFYNAYLRYDLFQLKVFHFSLANLSPPTLGILLKIWLLNLCFLPLQTLSLYVSLLLASIVHGTSSRSCTTDKSNDVNSAIKSPSIVSQFLTYKDPSDLACNYIYFTLHWSCLPVFILKTYQVLSHLRGCIFCLFCWEHSPLDLCKSGNFSLIRSQVKYSILKEIP